MFDFFKKKKPEENTAPDTPEVLGFRLGGSVELSKIKIRLLEDKMTFDKVATLQLIQAVGIVKLDADSTILRYYTDDDGFFQVVLEGGLTENNIRDVQLWFYYDTEGVAKQSDWDYLLNNNISKPEYEFNAQRYSRVWTDLSTHAPPVAMTETTYTQDNKAPTSTDQFVMLYERVIENDLSELLLVSAEETLVNDQADRCLVRSTGINLHSADFEIVS